MRRIFPTLVLLLTNACGLGHYELAQPLTAHGALPKKAPADVAVYFAARPNEPFRELYLLRTNDPDDTGVDRLRAMAANAGCDGVIVLDAKSTVSNKYQLLAAISDDPYWSSRIETEHEHRGVCIAKESTLALLPEPPPPPAPPPFSEVRGVRVSAQPPAGECSSLGVVRAQDESYNRARLKLIDSAKAHGARYLQITEKREQASGDDWIVGGQMYACPS